MSALTRHFEHWPPGVPTTLAVPDRHLFSHLQNSAQASPDRTAIEYYGRHTSFRQLHEAALALAGYLQQRLGVKRGDRVLLLMQNCPQFVIAYYAVLRCDAVVVAVNPMSTAEEIGYYAADSGARVLVTTQEMMERAGEITDLKRQVKFELAPAVIIKGKKRPPLAYIADHVYVQNGQKVVEDVKGMVTKEYRIKRHLMKSVHGIDIQEL